MGGCTTPEKALNMGLNGQKYPPGISVKKSAIFYDGRILGELGLLRQD